MNQQLQDVMEVCAAVADDTLRMCLVLNEMARVGLLPILPWDVATAQVELHHAQQAAKEGLSDGDAVLASQRVEDLKAEVTRLQEVYRQQWIKKEGGP